MFEPCRLSRLLSIRALVLLAVSANAAQSAEPTLEQMISLRRASTPTVPPDGRFVAYAVRDTDWVGNAFVTQVWLADAREGTTRQLTFGAKSSTAPAWSPEGSVECNTGTVTAVVEAGTRETFEETQIKEELFGLRVALNISPALQIISLTQYDTQSRDLGSNNRLRWTFAPQGDLFVVYNHNLARALDDRWRFVSNQLPVKVQYSWRF